MLEFLKGDNRKLGALNSYKISDLLIQKPVKVRPDPIPLEILASDPHHGAGKAIPVHPLIRQPMHVQDIACSFIIFSICGVKKCKFSSPYLCLEIQITLVRY